MATIDQLELRSGDIATTIRAQKGGQRAPIVTEEAHHDVSIVKILQVSPKGTEVEIIASTDPIEKAGTTRTISRYFQNFVGEWGSNERTLVDLISAGVVIDKERDASGQITGVKVWKCPGQAFYAEPLQGWGSVPAEQMVGEY